ncbi:unnamed protein product [Knipowitschia caucasica]|uniref:C-type lectin domain-containing protein n=1 Tax=Knipowitschia caucasica TaxID=637954 RepID=A0AAV2K3B1_KNICA
MKAKKDALMETKNSITGTNATLGTTTTASTSTALCSSVLHCDEGWELRGTKCYNFSVESLKLTWSESREKCQSNGGDLVQIKSRDEQDFLEGRVTSPSCCDRFWIGLTDSQTEGEWLWCDGSPLNQR